jgi:2'-5' RNA ligase
MVSKENRDRNRRKGGLGMYAVIALFDEETERLMKEIWKELSEKEISFYADEVEDRRPHLTLASYNDIDKHEFMKRMDTYYTAENRIDITFSTIGSFLHSGTLFFSPTITTKLTDFHRKHHEYFKSFNDNPDSLYLPEKWIPHSTIANRLSPEKLSEAFHFCVYRNTTIRAKINEIAVIQLVYERVKVCKIDKREDQK